MAGKTINVPAVTWMLGDAVRSTASGVTVLTRPLYYHQSGQAHPVVVGSIDADYAGLLMEALQRAGKAKGKAG